MKSSTKNDPKAIRDISYYQQRHRNRVFSKIVTFISDQAQQQQLTQKDIADRIRKSPSVLSRILSSPSNLTLDTISDILLAVDAEAEPPEIVLFRDRRPANYMHPLMARALNIPRSNQNISKSQSTIQGEKVLKSSPSQFNIEFKATTGVS